jgi:hypothetical protein
MGVTRRQPRLLRRSATRSQYLSAFTERDAQLQRPRHQELAAQYPQYGYRRIQVFWNVADWRKRRRNADGELDLAIRLSRHAKRISFNKLICGTTAVPPSTFIQPAYRYSGMQLKNLALTIKVSNAGEAMLPGCTEPLHQPSLKAVSCSCARAQRCHQILRAFGQLGECIRGLEQFAAKSEAVGT